MGLWNEIPVMVGPKTAVVKVTMGWHLAGRVRLYIEGRCIDPAPKGAALSGLPSAEPMSKGTIVRSPALWCGVAVLASGLTPFVMKAAPVARLAIFGAAAGVLVAAVAWGRSRRRRREK